MGAQAACQDRACAARTGTMRAPPTARACDQGLRITASPTPASRPIASAP